jgi:hypothetical protein
MDKNAGGAYAARQGPLIAVQKFENTLTSKFGASGTGCCNVRASNFRPAEIHPATGNLNVDIFRIAGFGQSPHGKADFISSRPGHRPALAGFIAPS